MRLAAPGWLDPDPAGVAVGTLVGLGGLLFLVIPVAPSVRVAGVPIRPLWLSLLVLTAGFGLGAVVFLRRGRRLFGLAHAVGAVGWGLVVLGTAGVGPAFLVGIAVLLGGAAFLVAQAQ